MKNPVTRFILLFLLFGHTVVAQDSSHIRISLLTCSPGDELYSIFGHSAIRITDSSSVNDIVYNYGTFNFEDEGFYLKFIRGKLLYYISTERFDEFKNLYQSTNRGITEQVLILTAGEKMHLLQALNENLKEENRYYQYDFFLDNCTTRLRDIIEQGKKPTPLLPAVMPATTRYRQAIHSYLDKGHQYWSKLGIDILLGAPTDAVMTARQQQFLPDNLMKALDLASNIPIVEKKQQLYEFNPVGNTFHWFTPLFFFTSLLALYILLDISRSEKLHSLLLGLDGLLFFLTGALGVLLVFMMTATDHTMAKENYNILWAWPTHLVFSFFINRKTRIIAWYYLITVLGSLLMIAAWFFLPQQMNYALLPFIVLIGYRAASHYFKLKRHD